MDQLFDLGSRFDLVWDEGDNILLSVGDPVGLFPQIRLVRLLSCMGLMTITGLRFDAIVRSSFCASISEHFGAEPEVSAVSCHTGRQWRDHYDDVCALVRW